MKGTLSPGLVPGLLRELYVGRRSGLLHLRQAASMASVRFQDGHIVDVLTGDVPPDASEGDPAERSVARAQALRGAVLAALAWSDAAYSFEEHSPEAPFDPEVAKRLSTGALILETVERVRDPEVVKSALGDMDRVLVPNSDPMMRLQNIGLTPNDGYTLSRIDGESTAREVVQLIPLPAEDVERCLFALLSAGLVEYAKPRKPRPAPGPRRPTPEASAGGAHKPSGPPPAAPRVPAGPVAGAAAPVARRPTAAAPPPAPPPPKKEDPAEVRKRDLATRRLEIQEAFDHLKEKTHFEVLGIPRASNEAQVKEAYFRLARRFHPDAHHDLELSDMKDKLEAVFIRLGLAYEVLRNAKSRSQYEEYIGSRGPRSFPSAQAPQPPGPSGPSADATPQAAQASAGGSTSGGDYRPDYRAVAESVKKAEKLLEDNKAWDAIQLLEAAVPQLEGKPQGRALVLLARAYLKNPLWVRKAEETLLRVTTSVDARNVEAQAVLAGIYKSQGLKSRATSLYRRIVELQPDHAEANRELAEVLPEEDDDPPPSSGGRLLRKLFGRG